MTKYTAFTIKGGDKAYSLNIDDNGFSEEGNISFAEALNIATKSIGSNSMGGDQHSLFQFTKSLLGWHAASKAYPHKLTNVTSLYLVVNE